MLDGCICSGVGNGSILSCSVFIFSSMVLSESIIVFNYPMVFLWRYFWEKISYYENELKSNPSSIHIMKKLDEFLEWGIIDSNSIIYIFFMGSDGLIFSLRLKSGFGEKRNLIILFPLVERYKISFFRLVGIVKSSIFLQFHDRIMNAEKSFFS